MGYLYNIAALKVQCDLCIKGDEKIVKGKIVDNFKETVFLRCNSTDAHMSSQLL